MAGWDDTPPTKTDKDAQASHFAFNQFSAAFATDAPISASKFGREKLSFDDWSAPPVYALDEHASNKPTLFVGNLSWTITSEALFARLGGIGSVVACEVKRNGRGQSKGFALATFQSEEAAQRAIAEFHGAVLEGRRLVVRPDQSEGDRQRAALGLPRPSAVAPSARIFVGNVWFSVVGAHRSWATYPSRRRNAQVFRDASRVFEDAGVGARRAALAVDASGQSRGYGLVRFKNAEAAEKALAALEGLEIGGRPARCKVDERPDDDAARAAAAAAAAKARLDGSPS